MLTNDVNVVRYLVSGNTYSIPFPYWKTSDIKAYITLADETVQPLVYGTDYTVTTPDAVSGTLTKTSAWTDAEKLTIIREVELTQEIDLINGEKIDGEELEKGLDLKAAGLQQMQEQFSRSVMTSVDEPGANIVIPNTEARKGTGDGTILGFDGTGGGVLLRDLKQFDQDVTNTAANAASALASKNKAQEWAENPEDTPVEPGNYSAKHWAAKASTSAGAASVSAYNADQSAEDSEAWAVGTRNGQAVPPTDPTYHNSSKYYHDIITQIISGALRYQGTWTTTGATDYSAISTPRVKGDLFYCQGTACTIDGVTYTQGDLIIFNSDVAQGTTITTSMIDKIDNTETVTPDNICTLENKTIDGEDNTIYEYKPAIGVPTLWMGTKPDWALDFGNGASTKYLWANYPKLNSAYFKDILDHFKTTGGSGLCADYDAEGFYVPDLRGMMPRAVGTNGKGYTTDAIANVGAVLTERLPNIKGNSYLNAVGGSGNAFISSGKPAYQPSAFVENNSFWNTLNMDASQTSGTGNGVYQDNAHVSPLSFGAMYIVRYE